MIQHRACNSRGIAGGKIDALVPAEERQRVWVKRGAGQGWIGRFPMTRPADEVEPHAVDVVLGDQLLQSFQPLLAHLWRGRVHAVVPLIRLQRLPFVGDRPAVGNLGPPVLPNKAPVLRIYLETCPPKTTVFPQDWSRATCSAGVLPTKGASLGEKPYSDLVFALTVNLPSCLGWSVGFFTHGEPPVLPWVVRMT